MTQAIALNAYTETSDSLLTNNIYNNVRQVKDSFSLWRQHYSPGINDGCISALAIS